MNIISKGVRNVGHSEAQPGNCRKYPSNSQLHFFFRCDWICIPFIFHISPKENLKVVRTGDRAGHLTVPPPLSPDSSGIHCFTIAERDTVQLKPYDIENIQSSISNEFAKVIFEKQQEYLTIHPTIQEERTHYPKVWKKTRVVHLSKRYFFGQPLTEPFVYSNISYIDHSSTI